MTRLTDEAKEFFDQFVAAFGTFDGNVVARLFSHPYVAIDQHGNQKVLICDRETATYFQGYLDNYKSRGSESCCYEDLEVVPMGSLAALISVTWTLKNAEGVGIESWRESYCVLRKGGQLRASVSVDHAA